MSQPIQLRSAVLVLNPGTPEVSPLAGTSKMRFSELPNRYCWRMATNEIRIAAAREAVFDVLATAEQYSEWVVGPRESGAADEDWPARGSTFRHAEGWWPLRMEDETEVAEVDRPGRLVLQARMGRIAEARIEMLLMEEGTGTRVRMVEHLVSGPAARIPRFLIDPMMHLRNRRALNRLRRLVVEW
jgi:uncharacterized protein YndB with AHSA1/START domain